MSRSKSAPACVSSPWFSVFSLVLIISLTMVTHYLNTSLNILTQELELAQWKIKQGSVLQSQLISLVEASMQRKNVLWAPLCHKDTAKGKKCP